jgi:hypothetical protein
MQARMPIMHAMPQAPDAHPQPTDASRYARCVAISKRIRWDIERDVICGRTFDFERKFLPDGLSRVHEMTFLSPAEQRLVSQIQGRTYAALLGLFERFINAKVLELSREHWFGDQLALEALVRFSDEELKHQELFRRIESMIAAGMPPGYRFITEPNAMARAVLSKSTWAVLGLTCHIELVTQVHYRRSIERDGTLSDLYRDVFLFHWREESQHAVLDELEWRRENARLNPFARERAVDDLIDLLGVVDAILEVQAAADAAYFRKIAGRDLAPDDALELVRALLGAYRHQHIGCGVRETSFMHLLGSMVTPAQLARVTAAVNPIMA